MLLPIALPRYLKLPADQRHLYEVIRKDQPRKLYFDIDVDKTLEKNKDFDGRLAMDSFFESLVDFIQTYFGIETWRSDFLELDSSSEKKFSRHVIWLVLSEFKKKKQTHFRKVD